jgi:hypothetical protein
VAIILPEARKESGMFQKTFLRQLPFQGSPFTRARMGQNGPLPDVLPPEPAPMPEPEPAPEPALEPEPEPLPPPPPPPADCKRLGVPFRENGSCLQLFECKQPDGTITYKKEPASCPPRPRPPIYYFPYYPPIYYYPPTTPPEAAFEFQASEEKKTTIEEAAPYALGAVGIAAALYAIFS